MPPLRLHRPRVVALRAPQPAGRRQAQRGHAPGLVKAHIVHQVAMHRTGAARRPRPDCRTPWSPPRRRDRSQPSGGGSRHS